MSVAVREPVPESVAVAPAGAPADAPAAGSRTASAPALAPPGALGEREFVRSSGWALAAQGAGSTSLPDRLRAVIADSARNADLRRDITHEIERRGGAAKVVVFDYPDSSLVGRSIADIAAARGISPVDAAIALQLEGDPQRRGGARVRGFSLSELDIEAYAARPWVATATDGGIALPDDGPGTHARFYGTFPRKLRHYAIDRGVLTVRRGHAVGMPRTRRPASAASPDYS